MARLVIFVFLLTTCCGYAAVELPEDRAYLGFVKNYSNLDKKQLYKKTREFVSTYPSSVLSDNVINLAAKHYYSQGLLQRAQHLWKVQLKKYPNSDKRLAAELGLGLIALKKGQKSKALDFFERLIKRYPKSQEAEQAKLLIKGI